MKRKDMIRTENVSEDTDCLIDNRAVRDHINDPFHMISHSMMERESER